MFSWVKHASAEEARGLRNDEVVRPTERLSWAKTIGIGAQHVVAMFGATFLVPLLTGFSPATTLFFSAVSTALFLIITKNRVPSYLGSSFAFIAPIGVAMASKSGQNGAVFGIFATGVLLAIIGAVVHFGGTRWIELLMPPVVTGTIVGLIGLNLAPSAWTNFQSAPVTAFITLASIVLVGFIPGIIGRLSILFGVVIGYIYASFAGEVDFTAIGDAKWFGLPEFITPKVDFSLLMVFLPVVLVLVAENVGHLKSVAAMTGDNLDEFAGRALFADGLGTAIAGLGGGSGTTTYAENIGVMAATKIYSTAAYWVAAATAMLLALCPKFGVAVSTVPQGVLGGAATLLYGMIGIIGVRIWVENKVDFSKNINLTAAAVPLIIGIANFTFNLGDVEFNGIAIGSFTAIILYHIMDIPNKLNKDKVEVEEAVTNITFFDHDAEYKLTSSDNPEKTGKQKGN